MANPFIGARISPDLDRAIAARMQATGQTKSDIMIAALTLYLGMKPCQERLAAIEDKLSKIEGAVVNPAHAAHRA
ncbi:MAG: hypothetical protein ACFB5Z_04265 [Elainellaceae cyanobacterium]